MFRRTRYYMVSYQHTHGYGNTFFMSKPYLDIRDAEKKIAEKAGIKGVVIMSINEINKKQFVGAK